MDFDGFSKETTTFLSDLARNNDRTWFTANKDRYKTSVEGPAQEFLEALVPRLSDLVEQPMGGKIFRIYRDVRFSKDKTPYTAHVRVLVHGSEVESGSCGLKPAFYFSLEPDKVIVGTGSREFPKPALVAYRAAVDDSTTGEALVKLLKKYPEKDGFSIDAPALKRVPSGFDPDHPREALLRHKTFTVWREESLSPVLYSPKAMTHVIRHYRKLKPVFDWLDAL